VSQSLPEAPRIRLRAASDALRDATLARADAGVILLPAAEARAALAKLPQAALWQRLYQANRRAVPAPILSTHLANRRGTRVVVGFLPESPSAFQRLQLAGRLMREAVKPGVVDLALHTVGLPAAQSRAALEALASAALAAAAPISDASEYQSADGRWLRRTVRALEDGGSIELKDGKQAEVLVFDLP